MKLILLGLPLGNISDISLRAIETLKTARHLICEDSRVFNRLWQKLIQLNLVSGPFMGKYHQLSDFNERAAAPKLVSQLTGEDVVLISDAGMPVFSDPGYRLVKEAIAAGWTVDSVPGPTAATTALAISGMPPDMVVFAGFLPKKTSKIKEKMTILNTMADQGATVILYESPYRVKKLLIQIKEFFGDCFVVICRELTKAHQQVIRGNLDSVITQLGEGETKGEFVVLVSKRA